MTPAGQARLPSALVASGATLLLPGAGHLLAGRRLRGGILAALFTAGAATAAAHVGHGLPVFESRLGVFLFAWLLRSLAVLHAFALIDHLYILALPADADGPRRRAAAAASLLVPGAGQLLARSYLGAAAGLAATAVLVISARQRQLAALDLLLILLQGATALAAHQRIAARSGPGPGRLPLAVRVQGRLRHYAAAQVVALVVVVAEVVAVGALELRRAPSYPFADVGPADVRARPSASGVTFVIPKLGLSLRAVGQGWVPRPFVPGELARAVDAGRAQLVLRGHPVLLFMRRDRYLASLAAQMARRGSRLVGQRAVRISGIGAVQLAFRRKLGDATVNEWLVVVPRGAYAYLLRLEWDAARDALLRPRMIATRDSLRIAPGSP